MKQDILAEIIANKRKEVEERKASISKEELIKEFGKGVSHKPISARKALSESGSGIIAEFKRRSPSKGWIHPDAKVEEVVLEYCNSGASVCSVLTDSKFFGGNTADFIKARELANIPLLRKDFIIDEYQIYESRIIGADVILLIAAALSPEECRILAAKAKELGMETLLEIHEASELQYLSKDIDLLGINNRNLGTFHTDVQNSMSLSEEVERFLKDNPEKHSSPLLIAESGISTPETVLSLREKGFKGFLIGEAFMKCDSPAKALQDFIEQIEKSDQL